MVGGDVEMAIAMYFDGGLPAALPPSSHPPLPDPIDDAPDSLPSPPTADADLPGYEDGDAGPTPTFSPDAPGGGERRPNGGVGNGAPRGRRRPGTAPARRDAEDGASRLLTPALSQPVETRRLSDSGLFSASQLMGVYCTPRVSG
jgi:hypothetical protein